MVNHRIMERQLIHLYITWNSKQYIYQPPDTEIHYLDEYINVYRLILHWTDNQQIQIKWAVISAGFKTNRTINRIKYSLPGPANPGLQTQTGHPPDSDCSSTALTSHSKYIIFVIHL